MMRTTPTALAVLVIMVAQTTRAADETNQKPLEGTWIVVSSENGGKSDDDAIGNKVVFQGDKVTIHRKSSDDADKASFTIDPKRSPASIDIRGGDEGTTAPGIYKLNGDRLTICFRTAKGDRPAEFNSKADAHICLLVLKRDNK